MRAGPIGGVVHDHRADTVRIRHGQRSANGLRGAERADVDEIRSRLAVHGQRPHSSARTSTTSLAMPVFNVTGAEGVDLTVMVLPKKPVLSVRA